MSEWIPSDPIMALLVASTWKATIILGIAGLCLVVLAKAGGSAAMRHLVWACATGAMIALPVATWTAPTWAPDELSFQTLPISADPARSAPLNGAGDSPGLGTPAPAAEQALESAVAPSIETAPAPLGLTKFLTVLYLLIAGLLILRVLLGHWKMRRMQSHCSTIQDESWSVLLAEQKARLGILQNVTLLASSEGSSPMISGILKPTILLPACARNWNEEERRMVLTHELSHVKRSDCLTQTMAALACSIYWFHPGVWYAARRLRIEREVACDDQVVDIGMRPTAYARLLLETSRMIGSASPIIPAALSMASTQLENRMKGILDMNRSRRRSPRQLVAIAVAASALVLLPLGGVHQASGKDLTLPGELGEIEPDSHVVVRTLAAQPGDLLMAEIGMRANFKVSGWGEDSVRLRIEHRGPNHVDPPLEFIAGTRGVELTLPATGTENSPEWIVELFVPSDYDLQLTTAGGGISVTDVNGSLEATTVDGIVRLERFRGSMDVMAARGNFEMYNSDLEGEFRTDKGSALTGRIRGNFRSSPWPN